MLTDEQLKRLPLRARRQYLVCTKHPASFYRSTWIMKALESCLPIIEENERLKADMKHRINHDIEHLRRLEEIEKRLDAILEEQTP